MCAANLGYANQVHLDPLRILDYGGGNGELSRQLLKFIATDTNREASATVVDLFPHKSEKNIHFETVDNFFGREEKYDIVIASAVLEHLKDARKVLKKILESLTPHGLFYARTPYEKPLATMFPSYNIKWPRHIHDMGPKFWNGIMGKLDIHGELISSRTSLVESSYKMNFMRTLCAQILKSPSILETKFIGTTAEKDPLWPWVGGWEIAFCSADATIKQQDDPQVREGCS